MKEHSSEKQMNHNWQGLVSRTEPGVPQCLFELATAEGIRVYLELACQLLISNQLDLQAHLALSRYAVLADTIHKAQSEGRQLRASWFDQMRRAERDLGLHQLQKPVPTAAPQRANRFSRVGFANRLREPPR